MGEGTNGREAQMKKTDRRIMRTRAAIRTAFLHLMEGKDYESITVTDISERAGINRKTFYDHYETKEQLFKSMIYEMFDELFGIFMYEKENPGFDLDRSVLERDVSRFFEAVDRYREELEVMITSRTSGLAFQIAETIILERMEKIHIMTGEAAGMVPASLIVLRLNSFFLTAIDWWLDQTEYSAQEAAGFFCKMMRRDIANVFRYHRMPVSDTETAQDARRES